MGDVESELPGLPPPKKEGGRRGRGPKTEDGGVPSSRSSGLKGRRCFNCGQTGHLSRDCSLPPGNTACYKCGKDGHKSNECPN